LLEFFVLEVTALLTQLIFSDFSPKQNCSREIMTTPQHPRTRALLARVP